MDRQEAQELAEDLTDEKQNPRSIVTTYRRPGRAAARHAEERRRYGELAQLARAPALQAGGQRFESVILHREQRSLT